MSVARSGTRPGVLVLTTRDVIGGKSHESEQCARCQETLYYPTDHLGRLLARCPHCHDGRPATGRRAGAIRREWAGIHAEDAEAQTRRGRPTLHYPYLGHCTTCRGPLGERSHHLRSAFCSELCRRFTYRNTRRAERGEPLKHCVARRACARCQQPFLAQAEEQVHCSLRCGRLAPPPERREPRVLPTEPTPCPHCEGPFLPARTDQLYCSQRCRNTAHRRRTALHRRVVIRDCPCGRPFHPRGPQLFCSRPCMDDAHAARRRRHRQQRRAALSPPSLTTAPAGVNTP